MNIIGIALDELYRIFDILNEKYYENKLEIPVITIQKGKSPANMGWFTLDKVWKTKAEENDKSKYEINITPEHLNKDIYTTIDTLNHEIVHYANKINEIKDCNGQIHNKKFKSLAESVGLICEKSKKYGWGLTSCSEEFKQFIDETIKPNEKCFEYFRYSPLINKVKSPRIKKTFKYVCPQCDNTAKAKEDANLMCGDCDCQMERED